MTQSGLATWSGVFAAGLATPATAMRAAQAAVVSGSTIKAGPDFNTPDNSNREGEPTGTDFGDKGMTAATGLWKTALGFWQPRNQ